MWGCTAENAHSGDRSLIVPTYVGVYRRETNSVIRVTILSPRMWGCTELTINDVYEGKIVPTYVGVYREFQPEIIIPEDCPHVCGGVPVIYRIEKLLLQLSPRMWGCTV